jgi:hypothetical protein
MKRVARTNFAGLRSYASFVGGLWVSQWSVVSGQRSVVSGPSWGYEENVYTSLISLLCLNR